MSLKPRARISYNNVFLEDACDGKTGYEDGRATVSRRREQQSEQSVEMVGCRLFANRPQFHCLFLANHVAQTSND